MLNRECHKGISWPVQGRSRMAVEKKMGEEREKEE